MSKNKEVYNILCKVNNNL